VLQFLKDNRAKSFVLDIETDSTIMADENREKQRRTEFVGVLGQLLPQLAQMIRADRPRRRSARAVEVRHSTFRAGRSLDGAIDDLVEQMKTKGEQQKGDDPTTAMGKIQLQIEQIKDQTARAKIAADQQAKQLELQQRDQHHQQDMANQRAIAQMKIDADLRTTKGNLTVDLLKSGQQAGMEREAHQAEMAKAAADIQKTRLQGQIASAVGPRSACRHGGAAERARTGGAAEGAAAQARGPDMSDSWEMGTLAAQDAYRPLGNDPWTNTMSPRDAAQQAPPASPEPSPVLYPTASPLVNITQADLDRGIDLGLSFSGGGLATKAAPKMGELARNTLREAPEGGVYEPSQIRSNEKYFKSVDPQGNVNTEALVRFGDDNKTAHIQDILVPGQPRETGRGAVGATDMREMLRQFRTLYPEVEQITGKRVSGAGAGGGYA
jgi:hypothetical protein